MSLNPQEIDRIAHLARLALQPAEAERMREQMNGFFSIVEAMQAVDTAGIEPMAHPVAAIQDVALRLRDDVVTDGDKVADVLGNAPRSADGFFVVPKVVE